MHDLGDFSLRDMAECTARVRRLGHGAASMEEAAGRIVTYLYEDLTDHRGGQRACALVRFYKTHPYALLDAGRRRFAEARFVGEAVAPDARCLALLAAAGDDPSRRSPGGSPVNQAIPFEADGDPAHLPTMIRQVTQLGIDLDSVAPPSSRSSLDDLALDRLPGGVVHVADAADGPEIPLEDDFLSRKKIRSVLGFGGLLAGGDLFVVVLFTRVAIASPARDLFKTLALAVKVGVMSFERGTVFN